MASSCFAKAIRGNTLVGSIPTPSADRKVIMANYTIFSYDYETQGWGWVGTQSNVDPESFITLLDAPKDHLQPVYWEVVLQLPPNFFNGTRVNAFHLVGTKYPALYWVKNARGQIVDDDYDGPVEPNDSP